MNNLTLLDEDTLAQFDATNIEYLKASRKSTQRNLDTIKYASHLQKACWNTLISNATLRIKCVLN